MDKEVASSGGLERILEMGGRGTFAIGRLSRCKFDVGVQRLFAEHASENFDLILSYQLRGSDVLPNSLSDITYIMSVKFRC